MIDLESQNKGGILTERSANGCRPAWVPLFRMSEKEIPYAYFNRREEEVCIITFPFKRESLKIGNNLGHLVDQYIESITHENELSIISNLAWSASHYPYGPSDSRSMTLLRNESHQRQRVRQPQRHERAMASVSDLGMSHGAAGLQP
jgi:hypothetical protein